MLLIASIILLITLPSFVSTLPESCFLPEIRNEARDCLNKLSPMHDKLKSVLVGSWKSPNLTKDINEFCSISLNCYKILQVCAGIDKNLISNMDGVCDLYNFKAEKFDDCYEKLSTNKYDNCVDSFFMSPIYIDAHDKKQRCQSLKSDGKCVKKKAQLSCTKDCVSGFDDHLNGQLKRFNC